MRNRRHFLSLVTNCIQRKLTAAQQRKTLAAIKSFWVHLGYEPRLVDLTREKLQDFADWLVANGGAGTSINISLKLLARLAREAANEDRIPPLGDRPKVPNTPAPHKEPLSAFKPPETVPPPVAIPKIRPLPRERPKDCLDLYERWYEPRVLIGSSPHYRYRFLTLLRLLGEFLGRPAQLEDLSDETILDYMAHVVQLGRSAATANTHRKQLIALANFAARKKLIDQFPDVPKLQEMKRAATSWTVDQVTLILRACRDRRGTVGELRAADFWTALVLTVYDTGTRIGALLRTPLECLDRSVGVLTVPAEVQKTKQDQRFLLHADTLAALDRILTDKRALLFPWHRSRATLWDHFKWILKLAGLPSGSRDKFHRLRRTSATLAELSAGPGAATIHLGHRDKSVTELYLDQTMLPARQIAQLLPRPSVPDQKMIDGTVCSGGLIERGRRA